MEPPAKECAGIDPATEKIGGREGGVEEYVAAIEGDCKRFRIGEIQVEEFIASVELRRFRVKIRTDGYFKGLMRAYGYVG